MTHQDFSSSNEGQSPKRHINTEKIREYIASAFDKADDNKPVIFPGQNQGEYWVENSAKNGYYRVTLDPMEVGRFEEMTCGCQAGQNDWPYCWHKAALLNWVMERRRVVAFGETIRPHTHNPIPTSFHTTPPGAQGNRTRPALPHKPLNICRDGVCELDSNCPSYNICKDFHRRMGSGVEVTVIAFVSTTPQTRPSPEPDEARCEYCGVKLTPSNYGFSNRCKPCIQQKGKQAEGDIYG